MPASAFTGLPPKQLESIIVHELAHVLRRDYLVNILQSVVEILFFYHPAVWWINSVIRAERENCCDDIAIAQTGDSTNYARALAGIQEQLLLKENLAMAVTGHKSKLLKRIKRLLNQPKMKTNFIEGFTASCIVLLGIFAIVLNANAVSERTIENKVSPADAVAEEITRGIEQGLTEMNIDLIIDEAVAGIQAGLHEMNINAIVRDALKGANEGLRDVDVELIINEALVGIQAAMEGMDLNVIINEALNGVREGLKDIEIEKIEEEMNYDDDKDTDCQTFVGNAEHLDNLKKGVTFWNTWRAENRKEKVDLRGACLHESILTNMNLSNASLENTDLGEAVLDGADFSGSTLEGANLKEASLAQTVFRGANMNGINLKEVALDNLDLSGTTLTNANLKEISMHSVDLRNADLRYANLKEASLTEVDFSKSDLRGADLHEATIRDCKFKGAITDGSTLFPPGFNLNVE